MVINSDVEIRGNVRIYAKDANTPAFVVSPEESLLPVWTPTMVTQPVFTSPTSASTTEEYRLSVGDKANG